MQEVDMYGDVFDMLVPVIFSPSPAFFYFILVNAVSALNRANWGRVGKTKTAQT